MLFSELAKRVAEKYPEVKTAYPMDCELSNVELYDPSGAVPPVDSLSIYTARQIGQDMTLPLCFVCAGTPDQAAHDKIAYSDSNYIIIPQVSVVDVVYYIMSLFGDSFKQQKLYSNLIYMLLNGADLTSVFCEFSKGTGSQLLAIDISGKVLAYSKPFRVNHPHWIHSIEVGYLDNYLIEYILSYRVKHKMDMSPNTFVLFCNRLQMYIKVIRVIADNGTINENGGKYNGMDRYECRKAIVKDLEEQGYLIKTEPYSHNVGTCYRCHNDVEPLISAQWFVKMEPLAKEAIRVVNDGTIKFVPERFTKTYINWMENVHDWCISRQLWWGHQIPAWYCDECGHINVKREDPTECEKCGCKHLTREEDVLDTWFSSALWPFSTMGWPDKDAADLKYWYPTSVMVTGYDIIFFWVARMIFSGMEQMKKEPFKTVFIHGLVRDDKGRKMSKSLGNGIDPLEMAEKYGADALRFNLITGNSPGNDMRFYVEKCEAMRNFCNKIWNASRFVMMNLTIDHVELPKKLELEDKWILSKLNTLIREVTDNMDAFELGVASAKIYDFIWDNYCDWFIELTKNRLNSDDQITRENAQNVLCYVLIETLKLLHPFMPFITEEIWQALPHEGEFLMLSKWPEYNEKFSFPAEEEAMQTVIEAITAIRARRNEMNVAPSKKVHYTVATAHADTFSAGIPFFTRLASASDVTIVPADAAIDADGKVEVDTHAARIFMPLAELVDFEKELARIAKEKANAEKQLAGIENKLKNEGFLAKAPEAVVNGARADAEKLKALIEKLDASAAAMKK